jgi:hypothetical protein
MSSAARRARSVGLPSNGAVAMANGVPSACQPVNDGTEVVVHGVGALVAEF